MTKGSHQLPIAALDVVKCLRRRREGVGYALPLGEAGGCLGRGLTSKSLMSYPRQASFGFARDCTPERPGRDSEIMLGWG